MPTLAPPHLHEQELGTRALDLFYSVRLFVVSMSSAVGKKHYTSLPIFRWFQKLKAYHRNEGICIERQYGRIDLPPRKEVIKGIIRPGSFVMSLSEQRVALAVRTVWQGMVPVVTTVILTDHKHVPSPRYSPNIRKHWTEKLEDDIAAHSPYHHFEVFQKSIEFTQETWEIE